MEERYQIIEKIGQGGLGAVFRAFDTRMNRDIAIKRISVPADDHDLQKESVRQLVKEAGALAQLQHPHIVTIYDVGSDEEGPFVIMELITGKTLDEVIERAPLTWTDFREFALQTQEALIAAQELDMIHSDIKPPNIMLTWLPSGKFQVKIVDFGLATLTQGQSLQELQESEAIFGSIFFMAPEQFERVPVDARTDMYAMGCVYYQALTGTYPFQGETGYDVMVSHLHHKVIPIQEVRSDIPLWVCEWIMWQINRMPADRPPSAREALQSFLQNDKTASPVMSKGREAAAVTVGPRPRRLLPGGNVNKATSTHPGDDSITPAGAEAASTPGLKMTAPQPLLPPEGFKPSIHTEIQSVPDIISTTASATPTSSFKTATQQPTQHYTAHVEKKSFGMGAKIGAGAALLLVLVGAGTFLVGQMSKNAAAKSYKNIIEQAEKGGSSPISVNEEELQKLLNLAANTNSERERITAFSGLIRAKSDSGSNIDSAITKYVTTATMLPEVTTAMISEVIAKRANPTIVSDIIEFARSTNNKDAAIAAFESAKTTAGDDQLESLLAVIEFGKEAELRKAAEECAREVLRRSKNPSKTSAVLAAKLTATTDLKLQAILRSLQAAGSGR